MMDNFDFHTGHNKVGMSFSKGIFEVDMDVEFKFKNNSIFSIGTDDDEESENLLDPISDFLISLFSIF